MTYSFTSRAKKAIDIANELAIELGHSYIGTEHILYGLAEEGSGVASKVLENQEVTPEAIIDEIDKFVGRENPIEETLGLDKHTMLMWEDFQLLDEVYRDLAPLEIADLIDFWENNDYGKISFYAFDRFHMRSLP